MSNVGKMQGQLLPKGAYSASLPAPLPMPTPALSRLQQVAIRDVWPTEP